MKFEYQAKTKEGELQVGFVDAGSRESAINILTGHELYILSIREAEKEYWYTRVASFFGRVRSKDLMVFTRQLATLLQAHLPLTIALKTLQTQTAHPILKEAVQQISSDVSSGLSFSQALERQKNIFSPFFISMVQSSEVTGNLEEASGFLADYIEKENTLISKARAALVYPMVLVGMFIVVATIMITVVFPKIAPVFESSGVALPLYTRMLLGSGDFLGRWWGVLLFAVIALAVGTLNYMRTDEGKVLGDELKLSIPLVKKIYIPLTVTRIANVMATLLRGGVPVTQAVQIAGQTVNSLVYKDIMDKVAEDVRQGKPLSAAISEFPDYFPALLPQMLVVGEATGQIDKMLERVSTFYGREVDGLVGSLVDLIQPALMLAIGGLVFLLFASILVPLYNLTSTIQ